MAIKEALLVISAILAVTAAYPYNTEANTQAKLYCNDFVLYSAFIGRDTYLLTGCSRNNRLCINGLPARCGHKTSKCSDFYWYAGPFMWSTQICENDFGKGHCYLPSSSLLSCDEVLAQEESDDGVEGVKICETDRNGVKHCHSLSDGRNAQAMQEEGECFSARDSQGHKVCEPANCDAGRAVPPVAGDN